MPKKGKKNDEPVEPPHEQVWEQVRTDTRGRRGFACWGMYAHLRAPL